MRILGTLFSICNASGVLTQVHVKCISSGQHPRQTAVLDYAFGKIKNVLEVHMFTPPLDDEHTAFSDVDPPILYAGGEDTTPREPTLVLFSDNFFMAKWLYAKTRYVAISRVCSEQGPSEMTARFKLSSAARIAASFTCSL